MALRRFGSSTGRGSSRSRRLAFERLDARELLATLNVGTGQPFTTIQAAVNSAHAGDLILVAATGTGPAYSESVNLSLMGSAVASTPGALTIRGSSTETTALTSPGGAAFFNSAAFTGDLVIENLTLKAPVATAGVDAGIRLSGYAGSLSITNVVITDAADVGIEILNSSGTLSISQVDINTDAVATPVGLHFSNYAVSGYIQDVNINDVSDASILLEVGGTTQANMMLVSVASAKTSASDVVANDGLRVNVSGSARLDLGMASSFFDDLPGNSVDFTVQNTAVAHATFHDSVNVSTSEGVNRTANEPAVRFVARDTAKLALAYEVNNFFSVPGDNLMIQGLNGSTINATVTDNFFLNPGRADGDDAVTVTADSTSTATINVSINQSTILTPFGNGILVLGNGSSTINAILHENSIIYTAPGSVSEPRTFAQNASGISIETASSSSAKVSARITQQNSVETPTGPDGLAPQAVRIVRRAVNPSYIKVEADTTGISAYLQAQNSIRTPSISGSPDRINVDSLLPFMPLVVGDRVWDDTDKNGKLNGLETGKVGTLLTLTGTETVGGASVTRKTWTDAEGRFLLGGLLPGTYSVTLTPRAGFDLSSLNRGTDDTVDSDFRQGIRTASVTLANGASTRDLDAGLVPTDGKVWRNQIIAEDVDDNGSVTPLDALLVIIDLNANGPRVLAAPTANNTPQPFLDVDGNGVVAPTDALLVIIRLNSGGGSEPVGEYVDEEPSVPAASGAVAASGATSSSGNSGTAAPMYLPPEFFNPTQSGLLPDDDEEAANPLDAFFAAMGQ